MRHKVTKKLNIACSHQLDGMPDGHQCKRLHGHNYAVEVSLSSMSLDTTGMVIDFGIISDLVKKYDHQHLNEFFSPPTAEVFCNVLWDELDKVLWSTINDPSRPQKEHVRIDRIVVQETDNNVAVLERD